MNRGDFQQLCEIRIEEAAVLLAQQKWDGAYYLAGYAVECALKACVAKRTNQYDFPPAKKEWEDCYTHDFNRLIRGAVLESELDAFTTSDPDASENWSIVCDWKESSRYERSSQMEAESLYNAITDPMHGVLPWLKIYW